LAVVILMVAILNATLFRPINGILAERERLSRGRLDEAREAFLQVEKKLAQFEEAIRRARVEGYRLMENERAGALREREGKIASLKKEIAEWVVKEKADLSVQAADVRSALELQAESLGLEISAELLGRAVVDLQALSQR
jgi:F0F1-type ATP synthase membrane subunit b/b'